MFKIAVVGVVMAALGFLVGIVAVPALSRGPVEGQAAPAADEEALASVHEACQSGEMGDMQAMMESMAVGDEAAAAMHESCEAGEMGDMQAMMETAHTEGAEAMSCQEGDGAGEMMGEGADGSGSGMMAEGAAGSGSGMMGSGMMGMMGGHTH